MLGICCLYNDVYDYRDHSFLSTFLVSVRCLGEFKVNESFSFCSAESFPFCRAGEFPTCKLTSADVTFRFLTSAPDSVTDRRSCIKYKIIMVVACWECDFEALELISACYGHIS